MSSYTEDDYDLYDDREERHRRERKRMWITLGTVAALLLGAGWIGWSYFRNSSPSPTPSASAAGSCTPAGGGLAPGAVTINVYNATARNGLAGTTAKALQANGFKVGKISNDPLKKVIPGAGEVRYGPKGAAQAAYVATVLGKGAPLVADKRPGADVDLVLGQGFASLVPVAKPSCAPAS